LPIKARSSASQSPGRNVCSPTPRALAPSARSGSFGGGDGATDPLVMDDTGPITLD
jgi:hypothetical protein